ncbi:MAG: tetratricopeptide repeat protein, partial [Proteobacteria bacterium]|nr:tetratricopeptide repeat protein [Pseudomonadota bacterium]
MSEHETDTEPGASAPNQPPQSRQMTIPDAMNIAMQRHSDGNLAEAEAIYRQVLETDPNDPFALQLLGVIAHQGGDHETARELIEKAISIKPDFIEAFSNLGLVLQELGRLEDAAESFAKALAINPDYANGHYNLGITLQSLDRLDAAAEHFRTSLTLNPDSPNALCKLGWVLQQQGRLDDAADAYAKALALKPDYLEVLGNLGIVFGQQGRLEDAIASYHKALAIQPDSAEMLNNLGNALTKLGRANEAVESCHKALAIQPDLAEAHNNLGNAFSKLGRLDEAVASYHKALAIQPNFAEAHNNLGDVFRILGRFDEAMTSFHKALAVWPNFTGAGRNLLLTLLNVPGIPPEQRFAEHRRFSENNTQGIARPAEKFTNDPVPGRRLRVGYLSSDFRDHPVGLVVMPLISSHNREKFEIFCYADVAHPDAMSERFQSCVDRWVSVTGKSDADVAAMVRADGIDVLVSLAGHFDNNRPLVSAHRAAPVQVNFHDGATSGLEEMDYWLTDSFLHPTDTTEIFTEALYRLPVFYQWPLIEDAPPIEALPAAQAGFITFGSFNNPAKINDAVIRLWAEILKAVPESR